MDGHSQIAPRHIEAWLGLAMLFATAFASVVWRQFVLMAPEPSATRTTAEWIADNARSAGVRACSSPRGRGSIRRPAPTTFRAIALFWTPKLALTSNNFADAGGAHAVNRQRSARVGASPAKLGFAIDAVVGWLDWPGSAALTQSLRRFLRSSEPTQVGKGTTVSLQ
jgi:hypothetical protein